MYRFFATALLLLSFVLPAPAQQEWKLSTEGSGMKVYTSPVPDSKIKAIKVECDFNATAAQLVAVLLDVKTCPDWVYKTKSCVLIKKVSPAELYYYSEVNIPWPAQNRDFVAHLTVTQNPETKVVYVDGPALPGFVPVKSGIVRIDHSIGKWVITPVSPNHIRVVYTLQVSPGGNIPAWLVKLKKPAYKDITLPFIAE
jgi:hypothetical protein